MLSELARILNFPLFSALQEATEAGDKLGISGATLYRCTNYTSPLHFEDDVVPGLCAQYELQARKEDHEYAFIFADYGIYFVSKSNSLWFAF